MARKRLNRIAFQGEPGANSHLAARDAYPNMEAMACATFEDALAAVKTGKARFAMIPIENNQVGRVADIHHLLPGSGLYIIREHFVPIRLQLLGVPAGPCRPPLGKMSRAGMDVVVNIARTVQSNNPEILEPLASFFNVDIEARLDDASLLEGLYYPTY